MAGRRAGAGLALATVALTAAGCGIGGSTKTVTVIRTHTVTTTRTVTQSPTTTSNTTLPCAASDLSGSFAVVPGSQGAGQIAYVLSLTNTSQTTCNLSGRPNVVLLNASGSPLPTHVTGGSSNPAVVLVMPGDTVKTQARFSPDVPGSGDSQSGPCQPKAHTLQVAPGGGGTVDAPITPPTSVCERGALAFNDYGA